MRPEVLAYGFLLFGSCMFSHVIVWRIRTPRVSSLVLVILFLLFPAILALFLLAGDLRTIPTLSVLDILQVLFLHTTLSGAYIASYPAVRAVSPSLDILLMVSSAPGGRMTGEEISSRYSDLRLVVSRIDDLLEYRLIAVRDGRYVLQPLARGILWIFIVYRKLLGLPMGEG